MPIVAPWTTRTAGIQTPFGNYNATDLLRIPYISGEMPYLNQGSAVFWKILQTLPMGESVDQARFEFFSDTKFETQTTVNDVAGGGTNGAPDIDDTKLSVSDILVIPNMVLYNQRTEELVYVSAVAANGYDCTIERGWGGTAAAIMNVDDVLIVLGANLPEGANANSGIVKLPTKDYNYCSFFSETISETDVQKMANMRNNVGKIASSYTDTYNKMIEQMDNLLRFGVRFAEARAAGTVYFTGGFKSTCGNEQNIVSGFDYQDLNDAFNPCFRHTASSPMKIMVCGEGAMDKLITAQQTREAPQPAKFNPVIGAFVRRIELSAGGTIDVVLDRQGFHPNRNMQNDYFLIDPAHIKRRAFKGFEDITSRDVSMPNSHTMTDELYGSIGLEMQFADDVHAKGTFQTP